MRAIVSVYVVIAWGCVVLAIVFGGAAFVALTGAIALIAGVGLIHVWSWRGDGSWARPHGQMTG